MNHQYSRQDWLHRGLPPELAGNYCHITPERSRNGGQKLWFINAPYGGSLLRFRGEPTSLLYALAPLVQQIREGRIPELRMEDIALLNPVVRSEGFYAELQQRLESQRLRAVGISTMTAGCAEARRIASLVKSINRDTIVILGGPHEDDIAVKTALDPRYSDFVDFSVSGDGEYSLLTLARILFENPFAGVEESKAAVLERAAEFADQSGRGVVSFSYGGRLRQLALTRGPICLNQLPSMPRELLHESDTRTFSVFKRGGWNVKTAQVMTHRGCHWRCNFCSESATVNERSVESVIREIEEVLQFQSLYPHLDRRNYEAIFFDDSTFTNHSPRRRRFLSELLHELGRLGIEWGCQTRLDQIDVDTLQAMKKAGCSYIYTGLESASNELLRAMVKDEDRSEVERAFNYIARVGIRVGISLVFGATATGSDETTETSETIRETLDFVGRQTERGNVAVVSPNLATYYPGTRMTMHSARKMDFQNPVVNPGYPWNRFEEGEGFHPPNVTAEMAQNIISESMRRFGEYMVDQDLYSLEDYQYAYRNGLLESSGFHCLDFNHASLALPRSSARQAARLAEKTKRCDATSLYEEARQAAADLMGVPWERRENILLTRNATEAAALSLWLSGLYRQGGAADILCTDAENVSIPRSFRFFMDHGNSSGCDLWSSFQDFGARNTPKAQAPSLDRQETGIEVRQIEVLSNLDELENEILRNVTLETRMVVFSHVIRDTGRICRVQELCKEIRKKNAHAMILVDGAQALGALPRVDVEALGCDFYVAAPHKTLGTFPLGILYMSAAMRAMLPSDAARNNNGQPLFRVMQGMFSPSLGVLPTTDEHLSLAEVAAFPEVCNEFTERGYILGNDCRVLDNWRRRLKTRFLDRLRHDFPDAEICSPLGPDYSNFIAAFRIPGLDNRTLVENLWRQHLVFVSYIGRSDSLRFSFSPENSEKAVREVINALREVVETCGSGTIVGHPVPTLRYNLESFPDNVNAYVHSGCHTPESGYSFRIL